MNEEEGTWSESSTQQDKHREKTPSPPVCLLLAPRIHQHEQHFYLTLVSCASDKHIPNTDHQTLTDPGSLKTKLGRCPKSVISPSPMHLVLPQIQQLLFPQRPLLLLAPELPAL